LKTIEQFREAGFVRFTRRAIPVRLHPFGVLLAQGVVHLVLKLSVSATLSGAAHNGVHFHSRGYRWWADNSYGASVRFYATTYEVACGTSFEIEE
jgi:hypothetical protein